MICLLADANITGHIDHLVSAGKQGNGPASGPSCNCSDLRLQTLAWIPRIPMQSCGIGVRSGSSIC